MQNRIIRTFRRNHRFEHTIDIYKKFDILKIESLRHLETYKLMKCAHVGTIPIATRALFSRPTNHRYSRRDPDRFNKPKINLTKSKRCLSWIGPHLWNSLPINTRILTYLAFKKAVKRMLLDGQD